MFDTLPKPLVDLMCKEHLTEEDRQYVLRLARRSVEEDGCIYVKRVKYGEDTPIYHRPMTTYQGVLMNVPRVICVLHHNIEFGDHHTRHLCNNQGCINPEHLAAGTPTQNAVDNAAAVSVTQMLRDAGML